MKQIHGNLISSALDGSFDVIVHGCNCFHKMKKGLALQVRTAFPDAFTADLKTRYGDRSKLGTFSSAVCPTLTGKVTIVNAYTQFHWRGYGQKADYEAIDRAFALIAQSFAELRIGYPAIGAGLAGGDWNQISSIIDRRLHGQDHTLVIYQPSN